MAFSYAGGAVFEENLQIKIRKVADTENKPTFLPCKAQVLNLPKFLTCRISVLDGNGGVGFSAQDEHSFDTSDVGNEWIFPPFIRVNKLAASKDLYLQKDRLTLRCEVAISTGIASQEVEESIYGVPPEQTNEETTLEERRTLQKDLQSFYNHGTLSDVKLRAGGETYPAHWMILCARSAVFRTMFDTDMKEKISGIVDIPNLEPDDLKRLLVFLYTDLLEDQQWDSAKSLYSIADLYQIQELKRKCASFLVSHMSVENVCECLLFADLFQDKRLMTAVKDFICGHSDEVFKSDEWGSLMDTDSRVTAEIMHYVLNEKL